MAMKPCGQVLEQQGELAGAHSAYREALTAAKSSSEGVGAQHQFLSAAEEAACSLGLARTAVLCGDAGLGAALAAASEDQAVWLECAYLLEATQQLQASGRCCRPIKRGYCCHTSWWDEGATTWRSVAACAGLIAELLQLYTVSVSTPASRLQPSCTSGPARLARQLRCTCRRSSWTSALAWSRTAPAQSCSCRSRTPLKARTSASLFCHSNGGYCCAHHRS